MKFTQKEICMLLAGLYALAENARRAQALIFDESASEAIEDYIQEMGELNLKLSELDPEE